MSEEYEVLEGLYYTEEHEWLKVLEDGNALMGITDYAQKQLHEIVYVELPEVGREVERMESIGAVESVKAVSDIYSPIAGTIIDVNENLLDSPELLNEDPYGEGWIVKMEPRNLEAELEKLMSPEEYKRHIEALQH